MSDTKIAIAGCAGRMGRMLARQTVATDGCALAGGFERAGAPEIGADIGELAGLGALGIAVGDDPAAVFAAADVVIDFTVPAASVANAALAAQSGTGLVIGTTGLDEAQAAALRSHAAGAPIVWAPNMSPAVTLLADLVRRAAAALDEDYDIEVLEMHHRHKIDAPSGTALALGRAAAEGRGVALDAVADRGRDGQTGARRKGDIGFAVLRGGGVVGDHSVIFAGPNEVIELTHRAGDRALFAAGAVAAAKWVAGRAAGLYGLRDVLGLSSDE